MKLKPRIVALDDLAQTFAELVLHQIQPHPNGRVKILTKAQKMGGKDRLSHPVPTIGQIVIQFFSLNVLRIVFNCKHKSATSEKKRKAQRNGVGLGQDILIFCFEAVVQVAFCF
jgi:hypothetical protein